MKKILLLLAACAAGHAFSAEKRIVLIAGNPSHGDREHEYRAGSLLWQKCLSGFPGVSVTVVSNDWPKDLTVFEGADAIVMFCTGGASHPVLQGERLRTLEALMKKGV